MMKFVAIRLRALGELTICRNRKATEMAVTKSSILSPPSLALPQVTIARTSSCPPTAKAHYFADKEDEDEILGNDRCKPLTRPTALFTNVVIYDCLCPFCHRGVKWVIKADKERKIKFCCLQSETAEPYLRYCGLYREDLLGRLLFVEGPEFYDGSTAALQVLSHLPLPYSALSSLLMVPTPIRDAVYDYVAKRRYEWFGNAEKILILKDPELLERFIDRDELMGMGVGGF